MAGLILLTEGPALAGLILLTRCPALTGQILLTGGPALAGLILLTGGPALTSQIFLTGDSTLTCLIWSFLAAKRLTPLQFNLGWSPLVDLLLCFLRFRCSIDVSNQDSLLLVKVVPFFTPGHLLLIQDRYFLQLEFVQFSLALQFLLRDGLL